MEMLLNALILCSVSNYSIDFFEAQICVKEHWGIFEQIESNKTVIVIHVRSTNKALILLVFPAVCVFEVCGWFFLKPVVH